MQFGVASTSGSISVSSSSVAGLKRCARIAGGRQGKPPAKGGSKKVLRVLRLVCVLARVKYSKAEGWSGLKKIILGAGEHILDGGVREILAEEAGRKTITE